MLINLKTVIPIIIVLLVDCDSFGESSTARSDTENLESVEVPQTLVYECDNYEFGMRLDRGKVTLILLAKVIKGSFKRNLQQVN